MSRFAVACVFLERMENVNRIGEPGGIDYPVRPRIIPNSDFLNPFANGGHWLEVVRLFTALQFIQLVACILSSSGNPANV